MKKYEVNKTYEQINEKIQSGSVVVVTAEEMVGIVKKKGPVKAAEEVDVVTTGTFSPMCSSGAFINFGHTSPPIRASKVWFNNVPAYGGIAAVDCYLGATETCEEDPLNRVFPGKFNYGGGHVLEDLVAGRKVHIKALSYGTQCYPRREFEKTVRLSDLPYATLCNPRNAYQNYNCAVNLSKKIVYTYMGVIKPGLGNANYSTSGELSPLLNDPYYKTTGLGTKIFLGGAEGFVTWRGTQHNPDVERTEKGVPKKPAGTLFVMGDMKKMNPRFLVGVSIIGYGCSLAVGLGVPIPILNEEMAAHTGISDEEIFTQVVDYGNDYSKGPSKILGRVSYAQLKSGHINLGEGDIPTVPLSSMVRAREIAEILKSWIKDGDFTLTQPQMHL